eukprot:752850-Amphidinium_carterae.1
MGALSRPAKQVLIDTVVGSKTRGGAHKSGDSESPDGASDQGHSAKVTGEEQSKRDAENVNILVHLLKSALSTAVSTSDAS